jgi:hypothetical protein
MAKYRKKPVIIDAVEYAPGMEDGFVREGLYYDREANPEYFDENGKLNGPGPCAPALRTLEGHHMISEGDFIITGIKGERYPCKPDIFHATYEPVEEKVSVVKLPCVICNDTKTITDDSGNEEPCPCAETGYVEVLCNGKVHYRRPAWDKLVLEAVENPEYTIRAYIWRGD